MTSKSGSSVLKGCWCTQSSQHQRVMHAPWIASNQVSDGCKDRPTLGSNKTHISLDLSDILAPCATWQEGLAGPESVVDDGEEKKGRRMERVFGNRVIPPPLAALPSEPSGRGAFLRLWRWAAESGLGLEQGLCSASLVLSV